jgi:deoxyribodipyrimidine photo-lyase
MPTTMMWFRRDLRLSDNPALLEAVHEAGDAGEVVACFVLDDRLRQPAGAPRLTFLYRCLRALDESIDGRLVVRAGPPAATLVRLAGEVGATVVCCAEDFGPYGRRRDEEVAEALAVEGVELRRVGSPYAVAPGTIRTGAGESYKVFTPFSRAWREHGWSEPGRAPSGVRFATGIDGDGVPDDPSCDAALPVAGEAAAKRASRRFWDARLEGYAAGRDDPGADATSRLSVHLKYGTVHPRQLLAKLDRGTGPDTFRTELCWRESTPTCSWPGPTPCASRSSPACGRWWSTREPTPTSASPPGPRGAPAIRSWTPACASSGPRRGCTTGCG